MWERLLFESYAQLRGTPVDRAMRDYLALCKKEFPFYGATLYNVKPRQSGSASIKKKSLFGVSGAGAWILREDNKQVSAHFRFDQICSWATTSATFAMLVVTPKSAGELASMSKLIFETPHGQEISFALQSYVNFLIHQSEKPSAGNVKLS